MSTIYLDTETTGLKAWCSAVVEIALLRNNGDVLIDTRVNPLMPIPAEATAIHGITDADVIGKPTLPELMPELIRLVAGVDLVIYNAEFDLQFVPELRAPAGRVICAMNLAMHVMLLSRWPRLTAAAEWAGHDWSTTRAHSAIGDCMATRTVYRRCLELLR